MADERDIGFLFPLLLLDGLANPAADFGHDPVGLRGAKDCHQLLDASVTQMIVAQVEDCKLSQAKQ